MLDNLKKYLDDIGFLLFAVVPTVVSFFIDIQNGSHEWFQRSGSLMVLFAVGLEFRQTSSCSIKESKTVFSEGVAVATGGEMPKIRRILHLAAIFLIAIGTAIWGYGDVAFKYFGYN